VLPLTFELYGKVELLWEVRPIWLLNLSFTPSKSKSEDAREEARESLAGSFSEEAAGSQVGACSGIEPLLSGT